MLRSDDGAVLMPTESEFPSGDKLDIPPLCLLYSQKVKLPQMKRLFLRTINLDYSSLQAIKRRRRFINEVGPSQRAAREREFKQAARNYLGGSDDNIELINMMDLIVGSLNAKAARRKKNAVKEVHHRLQDNSFFIFNSIRLRKCFVKHTNNSPLKSNEEGRSAEMKLPKFCEQSPCCQQWD